MGNSASHAVSAGVVSIGSRAGYRPDFRGLASAQLRIAREKLGLDCEHFATYLGGLVGWNVMPATVERWEEGAVPPGDILIAAAVAADERYGLDANEALGVGDGPWIPLSDPQAAQGPLTGIWLSSYTYTSSSRGQDFTSLHYVVLIQYGSNLQVRSLPDTATGRVAMDLTVNGQVVTGTWTERTDTDGYYAGSTYHGAIQMLIGATADRMSGRWVGYGRDFDVNTGAWSLKLVANSVGREAMERFNKPVSA
jgi:DNA-binding transcriptional regulator YiaG